MGICGTHLDIFLIPAKDSRYYYLSKFCFICPIFHRTRQNELHAQCNSPYFANDPEKVAQGKIQGVPMKRLGSIEEVLKSVAYLLSEDSSYTTAFNLVVDGGLSGGIH